MYGMEHGGWMFGGGVLMLLWWLMPIAIVVALFTWLARHPGKRPSDADPIEILRRRYARGEIGKDEFGRMKRDLGG